MLLLLSRVCSVKKKRMRGFVMLKILLRNLFIEDARQADKMDIFSSSMTSLLLHISIKSLQAIEPRRYELSRKYKFKYSCSNYHLLWSIQVKLSGVWVIAERCQFLENTNIGNPISLRIWFFLFKKREKPSFRPALCAFFLQHLTRGFFHSFPSS